MPFLISLWLTAANSSETTTFFLPAQEAVSSAPYFSAVPNTITFQDAGFICAVKMPSEKV